MLAKEVDSVLPFSKNFSSLSNYESESGHVVKSAGISLLCLII